jgi:hypothetical protein
VSGPLKPVGGVLELQTLLLINARPCSIRSFWLGTSDTEIGLSEVTANVATYDAAFDANVMNGLSHELQHTGTIGTCLNSDTSARFESTTTQIGGQAANAEPLNVAFVLKFAIDRRYRGGKNHVYIPGMATGYRTDDSHWTGAVITVIEDAWTAVRTAMHGVTSGDNGPYNQVTVSRFSGKVERVTPLVDTVVENVGQPRICTRRRRLPKITG